MKPLRVGLPADCGPSGDGPSTPAPIMLMPSPTKDRWADAWPDALAFLIGLGLAWYFQWETRDLVWSLWLSSLVIGYAMIVWNIFGKGAFLASKAWQDRSMLAGTPKGPIAAGGAVMLAGGLFLLAFFTAHFGGFHFVHSAFLNSFFPINPGERSFPGLALYLEVFQRYWWFLPAAAIAERAAFRWKPEEPAAASDVAVTPEAIATRQARNLKAGIGGGMMAPYKNVIRLHLLIFFFAAAHIARLDNFLVYAVVYAVYFFPWRLVKKFG
jgi:hypothetical protein